MSEFSGPSLSCWGLEEGLRDRRGVGGIDEGLGEGGADYTLGEIDSLLSRVKNEIKQLVLSSSVYVRWRKYLILNFFAKFMRGGWGH